jgi:hypothetical protein
LFFACARVGLGPEGVCAPPSVGQSLTLSRPCACDGGAGVCVCVRVRTLLHARPQHLHGRRWLREQGQQLVSPPPIAAERGDVLFSARARVGLGTEGVRALPLVGQSLTLSPPCACGGGAGVCVCLCACTPACTGAVPPQSAVATPTRRRQSESPSPSRPSGLTCCSSPGRVSAWALRACVRRRRWVGGPVPHAVAATVSARGHAFGGSGTRPWAVASIMLPAPTILSLAAEEHGRRTALAATWRRGAGAL